MNISYALFNVIVIQIDDLRLSPRNINRIITLYVSIENLIQNTHKIIIQLQLNTFFVGNKSYKHVEKASESEAIAILLISDSLFRSQEIAERKKYVNIVDRVRENNGEVRIFSSLHVSGERKKKLFFLIASCPSLNTAFTF